MANSFEDFIKDLKAKCIQTNTDAANYFDRMEEKQLNIENFSQNEDSNLYNYVLSSCCDICQVFMFLCMNDFRIFDKKYLDDTQNWPSYLVLTPSELYRALHRRTGIFRERALKTIDNYQAMVQMLDALNNPLGKSEFIGLCSKYNVDLCAISKVISLTEIDEESDFENLVKIEEISDVIFQQQGNRLEELKSKYGDNAIEKILKMHSTFFSWFLETECTYEVLKQPLIELINAKINRFFEDFKCNHLISISLWRFLYKYLIITLSLWPNIIKEIVNNSPLIPSFLWPIAKDVLKEVEELEPEFEREAEKINNILNKAKNSKINEVEQGEDHTYPKFGNFNKTTSEKVKKLAIELARSDLEYGPYIDQSDIVTFYTRIGGKLLEHDSINDVSRDPLKWQRGWPSLKFLYMKILIHELTSIKHLTDFIAKNFRFKKNGCSGSIYKEYKPDTIKENPENRNAKEVISCFSQEELNYLKRLLKTYELFP